MEDSRDTDDPEVVDFLPIPGFLTRNLRALWNTIRGNDVQGTIPTAQPTTDDYPSLANLREVTRTSVSNINRNFRLRASLINRRIRRMGRSIKGFPISIAHAMLEGFDSSKIASSIALLVMGILCMYGCVLYDIAIRKSFYGGDEEFEMRYLVALMAMVTIGILSSSLGLPLYVSTLLNLFGMIFFDQITILIGRLSGKNLCISKRRKIGRVGLVNYSILGQLFVILTIFLLKTLWDKWIRLRSDFLTA